MMIKKFPTVTLESIEQKIKYCEYVKHTSTSGQIIRWAVITLENGFAVTGRPSCAVCAENDNEEMGLKIAYDNAFEEIWKLEGYLLKEEIYNG